MNFLKKHGDSLAILLTILGSLLGSTCWMNSKFTDVDAKFASLTTEMNAKFAKVDCRLMKIETVLIMSGTMPKELAKDVIQGE